MGIEEHFSLKICKHYRQPRHTNYRKLLAEHLSAYKNITPVLTINAMNDTLGPDCNATMTLVFGEHPPVFTRPEVPQRHPTIHERSKIDFEARQEMEQHISKLWAELAFIHAIPPVAEVTYEHNDEAVVFHEKRINIRIREWVRPCIVDDWDPDKKLVKVRDPSICPCRPFNLAQVKKHHSAEISPHIDVLEVAEGLQKSSHATDTCMTKVLDAD